MEGNLLVNIKKEGNLFFYTLSLNIYNEKKERKMHIAKINKDKKRNYIECIHEKYVCNERRKLKWKKRLFLHRLMDHRFY